MRQAAQFGVPIIEDDPYGELRYAGEPQPGLLALAGECGATVIRLGTFSKVLAPGLRLGYIAAPRNIINKLVQAKQATDLHTPTLTQMAVYEVVKTGFLAEHLPRVREIYRVQGRCMLEAIEREFPASVSWTKPEGGMFIWVTLPEHIDSNQAAGAGGRAERGLRAGRPLLRGHAAAEYAAPELRHGAGSQDPRRHRHPGQTAQGSDLT